MHKLETYGVLLITALLSRAGLTLLQSLGRLNGPLSGGEAHHLSRRSSPRPILAGYAPIPQQKQSAVAKRTRTLLRGVMSFPCP